MESCKRCRKAELERHKAVNYFNSLMVVSFVYVAISVVLMGVLAWRIDQLKAMLEAIH